MMGTGLIIKTCYEYSPKERPSFAEAGIRRIIEDNYAIYKNNYGNIIQIIKSYSDFLIKIPSLQINQIEPFWRNGWITKMDAAMLYSLVAFRKPRFYVEIGSGNSTKFAGRAIRDHNLPTKIISICPGATAEVDSLCYQVIKSRLEDIDLSIFSKLCPDDMLIVDCSHRAFPNSDVTVFFCEILPNLPKGLIYAIHDIALPDEIFVDRFYNEQYMLASYLLGGGGGDYIFFPTSYIGRYTGMISNLSLYAREGEINLNADQGFFWMQRKMEQVYRRACFLPSPNFA